MIELLTKYTVADHEERNVRGVGGDEDGETGQQSPSYTDYP